MIVESPAKAKTLKKYLGKDYEFLASYGHVRDLVPKTGAVDPDHDFAMKYQPVERNIKHVDAICEALKKADTLYLATDPDREGEAIAWHLYEMLKEKKAIKKKAVHRIVFHEITKNAVKAAMQHPRSLSMELVHAQLARRALDYLVGFNLSPLLWKKIRRGLSAGRVQSSALRLIVERQVEIDKFISQEYWSLEASVQAEQQAFSAKLVEYENTKLEQFSVTNEAQAKTMEQVLRKAANGKLLVEKLKKSQRKRNPTAPFTTSTLQQEAARKLGFTTQRTMSVAQQLYEGINLGAEGTQGLITYMRTDSVNLSAEAVADIRALIQERYGANDIPEEPRVYKTKSKNAQEAHEGIRPTVVRFIPEEIKKSLTPDQYKLYNLIWKRAVASQMIHATFDVVAADLLCGKGNRFRANGSIIVSPGFMQVYLEGVDDSKGQDDQDKLLPPMKEGDWVTLVDLICSQHFTEPPPKFSEASLVKALEEHGIGRPSTYASIISTLQYREYVTLEMRRFSPTDVGKIVNNFLTSYFTRYVDYNFTAKMEDSLDEISRGEKEWIPVLDEFWKPFINLLKQIEQTVQRKDITQEAIDELCPKCNQPLSIRLGKGGRFIGCTAYPECDYTRNIEEDRESSLLPPEIVEGRKCPKCESDLVIKKGKFGKFIGCSQYPKCKFIESLEQREDTSVTCPVCKKGNLVKKKSRYGTFFYSCNQYPDCKYAINNPPLSESCPTCQWPILTIKTTKRYGTQKVCPQKTCDYAVNYEEPDLEPENRFEVTKQSEKK